MDACTQVLDTVSNEPTYKNSSIRAENILYKEYEKKGIVYISPSIWEK